MYIIKSNNKKNNSIFNSQVNSVMMQIDELESKILVFVGSFWFVAIILRILGKKNKRKA